MPTEGRGRSPRKPKSPGEISNLLRYKKLKEYKRVEKFKKTPFYRACNIFNVISFFIFLEMGVCYMGPCTYEDHYCIKVKAEYGNERTGNPKEVLNLILTGMDEKEYEFSVNEELQPPPNYSRFRIGRDFLLHKELKGSFTGGSRIYSIHSAGAIVFLSFFVGAISLILFTYDMNQHPHSLRALTLMNLLTLAGFLCY